MKRVTYLLLLTFSIITFGCSSEDDGSSNQNETETKLLGKWYFGDPEVVGLETNNSFEFTSNNEVTYSYWTGGENFDFDTEVGSFSVDGDVLIMNFPDDVELIFEQKVVFESDYKVIFEPVENSEYDAYEGDYFKEGYSGPYEYEIQFFGYSSAEQQYPLSITYYWDDESGDLNSENITSQTNTDILEKSTYTVNGKIGFEYNVIGYEESMINAVSIKNLDTGVIIFQEGGFEIEDEELFIYDILNETYTIE